jgi:prepilin-type N-terminal cleavage/methylation domain-containing protein
MKISDFDCRMSNAANGIGKPFHGPLPLSSLTPLAGEGWGEGAVVVLYNRHINRKSAFTLLEIMIAIGLLAMVVVAIYASWNSILKGSRVALDAAAESQRERISMRTLHDSLLCACMFGANATNYMFYGTADGDFSTLSFVARLPRAFPRSGKFGDLSTRRIEFRIESGDDGKRDLVLRQRPLVMGFDKDEVEYPLVLARDVSKFLVEYPDPQTGDWVTDWTQTNRLPTEVLITLQLGKLDQYSASQNQPEQVNIVALPAIVVQPGWQVSGPNGQVPGGGAAGNGGQNINLGTPGGNGQKPVQLKLP